MAPTSNTTKYVVIDGSLYSYLKKCVENNEPEKFDYLKKTFLPALSGSCTSEVQRQELADYSITQNDIENMVNIGCKTSLSYNPFFNLNKVLYWESLGGTADDPQWNKLKEQLVVSPDPDAGSKAQDLHKKGYTFSSEQLTQGLTTALKAGNFYAVESWLKLLDQPLTENQKTQLRKLLLERGQVFQLKELLDLDNECWTLSDSEVELGKVALQEALFETNPGKVLAWLQVGIPITAKQIIQGLVKAINQARVDWRDHGCVCEYLELLLFFLGRKTVNPLFDQDQDMLSQSETCQKSLSQMEPDKDHSFWEPTFHPCPQAVINLSSALQFLMTDHQVVLPGPYRYFAFLLGGASINQYFHLDNPLYETSQSSKENYQDLVSDKNPYKNFEFGQVPLKNLQVPLKNLLCREELSTEDRTLLKNALSTARQLAIGIGDKKHEQIYSTMLGVELNADDIILGALNAPSWRGDDWKKDDITPEMAKAKLKHEIKSGNFAKATYWSKQANIPVTPAMYIDGLNAALDTQNSYDAWQWLKKVDNPAPDQLAKLLQLLISGNNLGDARLLVQDYKSAILTSELLKGQVMRQLEKNSSLSAERLENWINFGKREGLEIVWKEVPRVPPRVLALLNFVWKK